MVLLILLLPCERSPLCPAVNARSVQRLKWTPEWGPHVFRSPCSTLQVAMVHLPLMERTKQKRMKCSFTLCTVFLHLSLSPSFSLFISFFLSCLFLLLFFLCSGPVQLGLWPPCCYSVHSVRVHAKPKSLSIALHQALVPVSPWKHFNQCQWIEFYETWTQSPFHRNTSQILVIHVSCYWWTLPNTYASIKTFKRSQGFLVVLKSF